MTEGIRLKFEVDDLATRELKRVIASLKAVAVPVKDLTFKFQYGFLQMQDAVDKFKASPFSVQMKHMATAVGDAVKKMRSHWDSFMDKTEKARGHLTTAVRKMKGVLDGLKNALTGIPAMIAGAIAGGMFAGAIKGGLQFNATLETLGVQFEVLTGSATRSAKIMRELVSFAARTPFQLEEVASSARVMMAYGLQGSEMLRRIGDAAAASGRPMEEVANTFGRIKSGAFGEAFQRLAEMGIATRRMLEGEGLVFDKSGSYKGSADEALIAVSRIIDRRFNGMMDRLSQTMMGKLSTLKDDIGMTLGVATGQLFDNLKPQLDRVSAAFKKIREGGTAQGIGAMLAGAVSPAIDKLIGFIEKPETAFAIFVEIHNRVRLVFDAMSAGVTWLWSAVPAFFSWLMAAIAEASAAVSRAYAKLPEKLGGGGWTDEKEGDYLLKQTDATAKKANLNIVSAKPGARDAWISGVIKLDFNKDGVISKDDFVAEAKKLMQSSAGRSGAVILGGGGSGSGDGTREPFITKFRHLGNPLGPFGVPLRPGNTSDFRTDRDTPVNPYLEQPHFGVAGPGMFSQRPRFSMGDNPDVNMQRDAGVGSMIPKMGQDLSVKFAEQMATLRASETDLFKKFYSSLADIGTSLFVDSMSAIILSKHEDLKLALNDIWQGMKANLVKTTWGMVAEWGKGKLAMLVADKKYMIAKAGIDNIGTGLHAGDAATNVVIDGVEKKSALAVAAAKIWKAFAGLPFYGQVLAVGTIAYMMKSMGAFASGGIVPGSGSGTEDDKVVRVSGGEGIITKRAVDANGGRSFIDAINSGRASGGGQTTFNFSVSGGGELLRLDIEREVVPVLERLVRQRRAVLS